MGERMWRVGIDVGGTFTDLFAWDENGREIQNGQSPHDKR